MIKIWATMHFLTGDVTQHDMQVLAGVLEGDDIKQKLQLYKEKKSRSLCKLFDTIEEWRVKVTIYTNQVTPLSFSLSLFVCFCMSVRLSVFVGFSASLPVLLPDWPSTCRIVCLSISPCLVSSNYAEKNCFYFNT